MRLADKVKASTIVLAPHHHELFDGLYHQSVRALLSHTLVHADALGLRAGRCILPSRHAYMRAFALRHSLMQPLPFAGRVPCALLGSLCARAPRCLMTPSRHALPASLELKPAGLHGAACLVILKCAW